jgi:hypothetical protein
MRRGHTPLSTLVLSPLSQVDEVFQAQKKLFLDLGKDVFKDDRAVDRRNVFLKRVEVVQSGLA